MPIFEDKNFKDYVNDLPAATENDLAAGNNMPLVRAGDLKKLPADGLVDWLNSKNIAGTTNVIQQSGSSTASKSVGALGYTDFEGHRITSTSYVGFSIKIANQFSEVAGKSIVLIIRNKLQSPTSVFAILSDSLYSWSHLLGLDDISIEGNETKIVKLDIPENPGALIPSQSVALILRRDGAAVVPAQADEYISVSVGVVEYSAEYFRPSAFSVKSLEAEKSKKSGEAETLVWWSEDNVTSKAYKSRAAIQSSGNVNSVSDVNGVISWSFRRNSSGGYCACQNDYGYYDDLKSKKINILVRNNSPYPFDLVIQFARSQYSWSDTVGNLARGEKPIAAGECFTFEFDLSAEPFASGFTGNKVYLFLRAEGNEGVGVDYSVDVVPYFVTGSKKTQNSATADNAMTLDGVSKSDLILDEFAKSFSVIRSSGNTSISKLYGTRVAWEFNVSSGYAGFKLDLGVYSDMPGKKFVLALLNDCGVDVEKLSYVVAKSATDWSQSVGASHQIDIKKDDRAVFVIDLSGQNYQEAFSAEGSHAYLWLQAQGAVTPKSALVRLIVETYTFGQVGKVLLGRAAFADNAYRVGNLSGDEIYSKEEIDSMIGSNKYITCWGDSLTAQGGWTARLQELSGLPVNNGGTGGETVNTIAARQGADVMIVDSLTIPAEKTPVQLATYAQGIKTEFGKKATPLLQGGNAHVNPCKIGDVEGTLAWTGSSYNDPSGVWTFTRSTAGEAVVINRPTALRTNFDMNKNNPYIMILYMGQNGGYDSIADLVNKHRLAIEHSTAKHFLVLGLSSGTTASRAEYEETMRKEFGRNFFSLREYLAHPIYTDGVVTSCFGLEDEGLTPTADDLEKIAVGQVPSSLLADSVHYTQATRTLIGELVYKRLKELNIL